MSSISKMGMVEQTDLYVCLGKLLCNLNSSCCLPLLIGCEKAYTAEQKHLLLTSVFFFIIIFLVYSCI
uniref:Uncharacterized protein n=1 Tax=Populus trichocarpa TaxID=3694 RepID=A0A2K1Z1I3_POPTR